jgi:hypothetical protein
MNPVLLKPESESRCQVVIRGRPRFYMKAREHERYRGEAWPEIVGSYEALAPYSASRPRIWFINAVRSRTNSGAPDAALACPAAPGS